MKSNETLLIHLGGLGDVCLSESTFYSLVSHFGRNIDVLGYKRFLELFSGYFERVHSVDERRWLWLFSDFPCDKRWKHTVLIGKDKSGEMRRRLNLVSTEPPCLIDMYPYEEKIHVEAYQLSQLRELGIKPLKKRVEPRRADQVILYPEHARGKRKWPYDHFLSLFDMLKARGANATLLEAPDVEHPMEGSMRFEQLKDTAAFFEKGGVFFSNDSGVAHLAGACGLATITLFHDQHPAVWHPRGQNVSIACDGKTPSVKNALALILRLMEHGPS